MGSGAGRNPWHDQYACNAVCALCANAVIHTPVPAHQWMPVDLWVECGSRVAAVGPAGREMGSGAGRNPWHDQYACNAVCALCANAVIHTPVPAHQWMPVDLWVECGYQLIVPKYQLIALPCGPCAQVIAASAATTPAYNLVATKVKTSEVCKVSKTGVQTGVMM